MTPDDVPQPDDHPHENEAVIYVRVSEDRERKGFSFAAERDGQLQMLRDYATARAFKIVEEFVK